MIRLTLILAGLTALAGCGFESRDNEAIGQIKKVSNQTPILCMNYKAADISMGVMRNGVGSMSAEDMWVVVEDNGHLKLLKEAAESGALVKIKYDTYRLTFCTPDKYVTDVQLVK